MEFIVSILRNKWFWVAVIIIILIIVIYRNLGPLIEKVKDKRLPSYARDEEGNVIKVTDLDKIRLDRLVIQLREAVERFSGMDGSDFKEVNALTDQELEYVAKTYKSSFGVSLYKDIDDEWLPFTNEDENLMARLDKLGFKS
jgi:hypothetical protein